MKTKADGTSDEDGLFLEQVLDKLYDFGTKKKKRKRKRCEEEEKGSHSVSKVVCGEDEHLSSTQQQQCLQSEKTNESNRVEVVTFQDPRKKLKSKQTPTPDRMLLPQTKDMQQKDSGTEELSLEKARLEVHRFGITGYKKEQQRVFEQDRAIMLGARPPKKGYVNYKVLQQQIKDKKQKQKEKVDPDLKKKKKKQNNPRDKKKTSTSGSGLGPSGQVGRFKNGMLILNPKEIQKIKGSKKSRYSR